MISSGQGPETVKSQANDKASISLFANAKASRAFFPLPGSIVPVPIPEAWGRAKMSRAVRVLDGHETSVSMPSLKHPHPTPDCLFPRCLIRDLYPLVPIWKDCDIKEKFKSGVGGAYL